MKKLYLVRGVSGSGKTTFAENLNVDYIFSADDFFMTENGYEFNPKELSDAHDDCQNRTQLAMLLKKDIAVANTYTQEWEMDAYNKLAESYGYMVFSLIVENRHGGENVHNVPPETIEAMKERFSVKL